MSGWSAGVCASRIIFLLFIDIIMCFIMECLKSRVCVCHASSHTHTCVHLFRIRTSTYTPYSAPLSCLYHFDVAYCESRFSFANIVSMFRFPSFPHPFALQNMIFCRMDRILASSINLRSTRMQYAEIVCTNTYHGIPGIKCETVKDELYLVRATCRCDGMV